MKTLLIAEDDPVMLKLYQFNLKDMGFNLILCREGFSVLERARAELPHLIVLDYMLPGKSGLELVQNFKADPQLKDIPIIIVTARGRGSLENELLESGAESVFTKPFSPKILGVKIKELLDRSPPTYTTKFSHDSQS